MDVTLTPADLIAFEDEVSRRFEAKEIHAPIHLSGGNEQQLIDVFRKHVQPDDWVCTSWRSHYHVLLKGVPATEVMAAILRGRSISLCFPEYKIISSAMVGGMAPIAVGLASGIWRKGQHQQRKVVCFLGDMAFESGIVYESIKYSYTHGLPLLWVVEGNGMSVGTPTTQVWGDRIRSYPPTVIRYEYEMTRPHVGIGKRVMF